MINYGNPGIDYVLLMIIILNSFIFIVFLFNCTIILLYISFSSHLRSSIPNLMFLIQSISDNLVAVPWIIIQITDNVFHVMFFMAYTTVLTAVMLLLLTIERFLAINFPFQHRTYVSIKKICVAVFFAFLISSIPAMVYVTNIHTPSFDGSTFRNFFNTMGSILLTIIVIVYILLLISYITIRKSIRMKIKQQVEHANTPSEKQLKNSFSRKKETIPHPYYYYYNVYNLYGYVYPFSCFHYLFCQHEKRNNSCHLNCYIYFPIFYKFYYKSINNIMF